MNLEEILPSLPKYTGRPDLYERFFPKGGTVLEVGVSFGVNAGNIWRIAQPSRLHLVDIWQYRDNDPEERQGVAINQVQRCFAEAIRDGNVILHQGYSKHVLPLFKGEKIDWIYVDGDHSFPGCLTDLMLCNDVTDLIGVHDLQYKTTVVRAIEEFCEDFCWKPVAFCEGVPKQDSDPDSPAPSVVLGRIR